MENRDRSSLDGNDIDKKLLGDKEKVPASGSEKGIPRKDDSAEEFPPELPNNSKNNDNMASKPTAVTPYATLALNNKDDLDLLAKKKDKLQHAPAVEPERPAGRGVGESLGSSAVVFADARDVVPGAFPFNPSPNFASTQAAADRSSYYDSSRAFAVDESKQDEETRTTGGADSSANPPSRMAESDFYAVEAQRVQEDEGMVIVAEVQHATTSWYQRPFYRWMFVGSVMFACILLGAVIVLVVVVVRPGAAGDPSSAPTNTAPASPPSTPASTPQLTPEEIACNFLSLTSLTECQAAVAFDSYKNASIYFTSGTQIPTEIGLLTQLTHLDLTKNGLTGSIPSSITSLTQLNALSFGSNQLTGKIPPSLSLLTQLKFLTFYDNVLTGTIPSSFSNLTQLTVLGFDINQITGTIPSSFSSLTKLQDFALVGNQLTGIFPSSLCSQMTRLRIDCGAIICDSGCPCNSSDDTACPFLLTPEQIACDFLLLTSLTECRAATEVGESITGTTIPSELGLLTQLRRVALYSKALIGSIPSSLSLLTQLSFLSFYNNELTGTIPSSLSSLTLLTGLGFDMNQMTGKIPSSFSKLTELQDFAVFSNQLTGSIPISLCSQMTRLRIDCGEIVCDSSCPCSSSNDTACSIILLTPEQIACNFLLLTSLTECRAATDVGESTTGTTIPSELGLLTQLRSVALFSKGLTGSIPQSLAQLAQLTFLSFYDNALTGTIPSSFSNLTQLTVLGFDMNQMTGTIPSSFSSLTHLQDFALFGNQLTGAIPPSLCPQMTRLRIDCGEITCDSSCPCNSSNDAVCP